MTLKQLAPNKTEVAIGGGLTMLFSFGTPVACVWTNGVSNRAFITSKKWSTTTSRHITMWLKDWTLTSVETKDQTYFDHLVEVEAIS